MKVVKALFNVLIVFMANTFGFGISAVVTLEWLDNSGYIDQSYASMAEVNRYVVTLDLIPAFLTNKWVKNIITYRKE